MSGNLTTSLVQFTQFSGVEINVHLVLEKKSGRQEQKLITLNKYVRKYPQGWKKRLELADLLYEMGKWQAAVLEYSQVIEQQPQLFDIHLKLGKILHLMGLKKEALEIYEKVLLLSNNPGTQHHINGLIASSRGDIQKAITAFNLAATLEPDKEVHWLALAKLHQERENPIDTLTAYQQVLSINPNDLLALIHSYDIFMGMGNMEAAIEYSNKLIALAADDFRVLQRQIEQRCQMRLVLGQEGKLTKNMITSLLRQTPDGVQAHNSLAYYHIFRGDWEQGVKVLAEFTTKHPHHPYGWYYYGRCLFNTGEYEKAGEMMWKAYLLYPDDCEIYRGLCEILPFAIKPHPNPTLTKVGLRGVLTKDAPMDLTLIVAKMLKRFPECWSVWTTAGRLLVEYFQEMERGCEISEKAIQIQPQLADAWLRYGRVLALAGKHQEAVEALETGWDLLPTEAYLQLVPVSVWLGESYGAMRKVVAKRWWKEAGEGVEELRKFNPAIADYWLGRALVGLGDTLGAIRAYESALNYQLLYPVHGEVKKVLQRLKGMYCKG